MTNLAERVKIIYIDNLIKIYLDQVYDILFISLFLFIICLLQVKK